jgi:hypothetical protein
MAAIPSQQVLDSIGGGDCHMQSISIGGSRERRLRQQLACNLPGSWCHRQQRQGIQDSDPFSGGGRVARGRFDLDDF